MKYLQTKELAWVICVSATWELGRPQAVRTARAMNWHDYMPNPRDDPIPSSHQPWKGGAAISPSKTYQEAEA